MEPTNETIDKKEKCDNPQEHKEKPSEGASDRESSIESFYTNKSETSNTADTELIDVDDIELSDEESWLYKSPKKLSAAEKQLSTQKWLNKNVNDITDVELHRTKNALVSKLNQLKLNESEKKMTKENSHVESKQTCDKTVNLNIGAESETTTEVQLPSIKSSKGDISGENNEPISVKGKENEVLDVSDVHKIAQLQEESLRQSTSRFLSQTDMKNGHEKHFLLQTPKLSKKPSSVEALNVCNEKLDGGSMYSLVPLQNLKKQNLFGSSSLLNKQDAHRSSLPNINPGYYSLRSKKSKRADPKMACPLPIYPSPPKSSTNGALYEAPAYESQRKLSSPLSDYRESRTLPSSYRVNSRSSSTSRRNLSALSPSPRRESTSFLPGSRNSPTPNFPRRESAPCNPPKYLSPVSSPTMHQRGSISPLVLQSPTKLLGRNPPNHLKSPPSAEYLRSTSHSPSRRLPLTTVHNRSPKRGNSPASPRNEEIHAFKLASKIPSPGLRSGIPVPSTYMARVNSDDESWSHDCF